MENGINGDDLQENGDPKGTACGFADNEAELKRGKFRAKSAFTRIKNKVLFLIDQPQKPEYREIQEACNKMDSAMESAMDVMTRLSDIYGKNKQNHQENKVILEMETLDNEFSSTYAVAQQYIHAEKEQLSEKSEILSVDLLNRMNISDQSETYRKDGYSSQEVGNIDNYQNVCTSGPLNSSEKQTDSTGEYQKNATVYGAESKQAQMQDISLPKEQYQGLYRPIVNKSSMNASAAPFEPTATCQSNNSPTIGQDLWRQLKRVQIPVFTGDKKKYQSWKASFLACIDSAPATAEYKLLQLRQYVSGDALKVIDSLGHSAAAYEAAKERLERKYGGKRRQIALYLEELEEFPQIRLGHAKDIEDFA
ncbi:MAG: DUF1759 domain-containing protein, partial [Candidatus Thiodiazotropha endolucinida]